MLKTRHMLTALLPLAVACGNPAEPHYTSPTEVALTVGREVRVDSLLRVSFVSVLSDSRCPLNVMCVWAGDAAVMIACAVGMGPSQPDTLHTYLDPKAAQFSGYTITLLELDPYPATDPIPQSRYVARLRIERL